MVMCSYKILLNFVKVATLGVGRSLPVKALIIFLVSVPEIRIIATPPYPAGVDIAQMLSWFISE